MSVKNMTCHLFTLWCLHLSETALLIILGEYGYCCYTPTHPQLWLNVALFSAYHYYQILTKSKSSLTNQTFAKLSNASMYYLVLKYLSCISFTMTHDVLLQNVLVWYYICTACHDYHISGSHVSQIGVGGFWAWVCCCSNLQLIQEAHKLSSIPHECIHSEKIMNACWTALSNGHYGGQTYLQAQPEKSFSEPMIQQFTWHYIANHLRGKMYI